MSFITFGQKEDAKEYIKRPAVYCLIIRKIELQSLKQMMVSIFFLAEE
ncbi:hypothetical protein [Heyndrickxia oleronia]